MPLLTIPLFNRRAVPWDTRSFVQQGFHEYKGRFRTLQVSTRVGGAGRGEVVEVAD